jgi:hypothetical protein
MFFALVVAAAAALGWSLLSLLTGSPGDRSPHDPSTLELAAIGIVTLWAYAWANRARRWRSGAAFLEKRSPVEAPHFATSPSAEAQEPAEHAA